MNQKSWRKNYIATFLWQASLFQFSFLHAANLPDLPNIGDEPTSTQPQSLTSQIIQGDFKGKPELMFTSWQGAGDAQKRTFWNPDSTTPIIQTQQNKTLIPPAAPSVFHQMGGSFLRLRTHLNHPGGATLLPGSPFAGLFDSFLAACKAADESPDNTTYTFLIYFSQFHLNVLQELCHYLISIYTTMSLSIYGQYSQKYLDYVRNNSGKEPTEDAIETWQIAPLPDYLAHEDAYALNKKTLIINHLINIIETQINKSYIARFPALPQNIASRAGMTMMTYDYGARLELLLPEQETAFIQTLDPSVSPEEKNSARTIIAGMRTKYLQAIGAYFTFFQGYAGLLEQKNGPQEFARLAKNIENILAKTQFPPTTTAQDTITQLRQHETINPPLFFYNNDVIRGIKFVPALAQTLPANSQKVPLPKKITDAATNGTKLPFSNNYVAFYDNGDLYVTLSSAQGIFAQKLIPQPAWLNSAQGITKMLRACLGDFSTLLDDNFKGESILNPCLTCIISQAVQKPVSCVECTQYLTTLRDLVATAQRPGGTP